jgi:hypothetical protein
MCWSATADAVAGSVVGGVGVACLVRVRRVRDAPLAALPLVLGVHQLVEAVVWHNGGGSGVATVVWAVIAMPLLAAGVPLAVLSAAPPGARARLALPVAAGITTAVVLAACLVAQAPIAEIRGHTVGYRVDVPQSSLVIAGYLLATVGSLLFAPYRALRLLGALTAAGAVVCAALWRLEFVSTWCALAAVTSIVILAWVGRPSVLPAT